MDYDLYSRESNRRHEMVSVLWRNHGCGQEPDCKDPMYGICVTAMASILRFYSGVG